MRHPALLVAAAVLLAASAAGAAPAAPNTASVASDGGSGWRVECGNDGKALDCRTINRVSQRENQQLIASVGVHMRHDTKKPVITIQLPLGIQIGQQATLRIDEGQPERYPIQTCTPTGCLAGAPASDALIAKLRSGHELKVSFHSMADQTVTVTMPLAGFGLAYDKIK